ncbi:hypothetical protein T440DRAFT_541832 [Plenodomus tracheiphilus IPT5]|uniref:Uncharacterized protein n=1 Tax=Plenodomus tracheiphilus IPT5 TaxID=1408161 RepID=A0A6A7BGX7_9PLEO|nr:hypothetical protein T440DRAFT_541832 [Plenodomus tracheiphilus IPT5]
MANRLEVSNPFTRYENRMRRNTRNSRWVAAKNPGPGLKQRAGPSHSDQHVTLPQAHTSHLHPRLADVDDDEPKFSPDEYVSSMTSKPILPQLHVPLPASYNARDDSVTTDLHCEDYLHPSQIRTVFDPTVDHSFPTIKKPKLKPEIPRTKGRSPEPKVSVNPPLPIRHVEAQIKGSSQKNDWWHTAKDIYKTGPQGEGQKVWKAYQHARKERSSQAETRQNIPTHTQSQSQTSTVHQKAADSTHPVHTAIHSPPSQITRRGKYIQSTIPPALRKQSELSRTSYEVPLSLDSSTHRTLNINKPLPRVPQLDPAPKHSRQKGPTVPSRNSSTLHEARPPKPPTKDPWWRTLSDKQTSKAHAALKAKVSQPGPLLVQSSVIQVTNATTPSIPPKHPIHAQNSASKKSNSTSKASQKERDDTPPTHWLTHFTPTPTAATLNKRFHLHRPHNRRQSSEESFACRGLQVPGPVLESESEPQQGLGKADVDAFKHAQLYLNTGVGGGGGGKKGEERLVPEPLFSRSWVGVEKMQEEEGDYRAVERVLREY